MRLEQDDLLWLERFAKTPDGQRLLGLLNSRLAEVSVDLRKQSGEALYRAQGAAVLLDELLQDITEASQRLMRQSAPTAGVQRHRAVRPL
jgi:hypothetical protein